MGSSIGLILSLVSTGVAVAGAVSNANSVKRENIYRQQVAENNAKLSEYNAQESRTAGAKAAQGRDRAARAIIGEALAAQGASGLTIGVGSFSQQIKSDNSKAQRDRTRVIDAANKDARGYTEQAAQFRRKSGYLQSSQQFNNLAGILDIGNTLIGGASKFLDIRRRGQLQARDNTPGYGGTS